ncbi:hypothetical protein VNO80_26588 [Phaseolus coccineus]|uniref:Bet v I/Major latex protein domain-containing protein n=1 Tax=Phaseolus coccineus TaxID=3886 RepID=A0AAN9LI98_PHACN
MISIVFELCVPLEKKANMAYSQIQKMEVNVHIMASAEQFHDVLCNKTHHIANISPQNIKSVQILKGEWGTEGSIIFWNYVLDGKACVSTNMVEGIDKENNKVNLKVIDGEMLKNYKSCTFIAQAIPKENGSVVNWVAEYEKQNANTPEPHTIMELITEMTEEIGAYLTQHTI